MLKPCTACAKRRKALAAKRAEKLRQGKKVQAAAISAVMAASQAAGKAIGINGEVEDERDGESSGSPEQDR